MGLDCYWLKLVAPGQTAKPVEFDPPLNLCGGLLSGGNHSFRGKVYAADIEEISGISLYTELLSPAQVSEIALALEKFGENPTRHVDDLEDLTRMFVDYAEAGYCLHGWW